MPKKNKRSSLYIPSRGTSHSQRKRSTLVSTPAEYHQTIDTLLLRDFRKCVDGNLFALVIKGVPTIEQLLTAWDDIQMQYADTIGDAEHQHAVNMMRDIILLKSDYNDVFFFVSLLRIGYLQEMADKLNDLVDANLDLRLPENLDNCIKRAAGIKISIDYLQLQYDAIKHKHRDEDKDDDYFISFLIALSDHAGFRIDDSITVKEYCERIKRLKKYHDVRKHSK